MSFQTYRGRFAPTPSGPLHLGSLIAALGSYLEARTRGGEWLLRIEDIDPPRVIPGAADAIMGTLAAFGFEWDAEVVWQSRRLAAYAEALHVLHAAGAVYACCCSRKTINEYGHSGADGYVYPGTCRFASHTAGAWRLRVESQQVIFADGLQGTVRCNPRRELGDFVIQRADAVFAYQLAVVVDDAAFHITDVVRGADLLNSTPRQILLQQALGLSTPRYLHLPVLLDAAGNKLSKQTLATPLVDSEPLPALRTAMQCLGFSVPVSLTRKADFWPWAFENWDVRRVPRLRGMRA